MRLSVTFAAALAAIADAGVLQGRQRGNPDVSQCGLDAFEGHTSEALVFCSNILKSGTATETVTRGGTTTVTTTKKTTTTVYPTKRPTPTPKPSSTPKPVPSSTIVTSAVPSPSGTPGCGIVGYVKTTPAYYFESSGTKNTFTACQALCKADSKCLSFGYGEANCMLFDVFAADNTNYNPMSPYTFYDVACPKELPVRKRQLNIELPGGIGVGISLGLSNPKDISSACSCFITKGPAGTTITTTATDLVTRTTTTTSVVTRTARADDAAVAGGEAQA